MSPLEHDERLFAALIADGKRDVSGLCRNAHWLPYAERIEREIKQGDLNRFRTNYRLLKGFAVGGVPVPTEPRQRWKRAVWRALEAAPLVVRIIGEYRRLNAALYRENTKWRVGLAALCLDAIRREYSTMEVIEGTDTGGADDTFELNGVKISAQWLIYLARAADFYRQVPAVSVRSLIEIGPGMGLNTLAHLALNPYLRVVINCDLPPMLYLSTLFLRGVDRMNVIDYTACADRDTIDWRSLVQGEGRCTVYQIPPWKLANVAGPADYFLNSFSFQEMDPDIVELYLAIVAPRIRLGAYVHAYDSPEPAIANVMKTANTLSFVRKTLASHGLRALPFEAEYWPRYWRGDPTMCLLMQR